MKKQLKMSVIEQERLFGKDVDLFKNYHTVKFLHNIIKTIGLKEIQDDDFYHSLARFLTMDEISAVYDEIMPRSERKHRAETNGFRSPPELMNDDPADVLSYIGKDLNRRQKMWRKLEAVYAVRQTQYEAAMRKKGRCVLETERRFNEMAELFELTENEVEILLVIFLAEEFVDLGDFKTRSYRKTEKIAVISKAVGMRDFEVARLLGTDHAIGRYGLLDEDGDLDQTFMSYLSGISSQPLSERFWSRYSGETLPWIFYGKMAEKHGAILKEMIAAKKPDTGISVLLFGVAGSGKTCFAESLAKELGKDLYFIAQNDDDNRRMSYSPAFRFAALSVAQRQLDPDKCILVVDECDKMVENTGVGGGLLSMLGINSGGSRDGEAKGQLNTVIDQNRHTVLWICNSKQDAIDPSSRRRFDYSVFFDELSAASRRHIWDNALKFHGCEGKLSEEYLKHISSRFPVNPGGISVAVKNAANLCKDHPEKDFEKEVITFLKAHCALLGIAESSEDKMEPARDYTLDGLNIRSGIKLPRLIDVCRNFLGKQNKLDADRDAPRMNLLLFGVPGSGKTEFVKYLAKQLDKPLNIKNGSDLLGMYVGQTEQRIVEAFGEAEANGEILFIDEGDSMLASREGAVRSWEVTQVNTLLTGMERFRGIFIVSTNMIQRLDQAALRRFSFRLHFDYLTNEGKEKFFSAYFKPLGLPELTGNEREMLHAIDQMTPSDFRNVRQQFFYLEDSELTNREVIEALTAEVKSKTSGSSYTGLGKIASRIGF